MSAEIFSEMREIGAFFDKLRNQSVLLVNPRLPEMLYEKAQLSFKALNSFAELQRGHVLMLTSGSTSTPKLVALSQSALATSAHYANVHLATTADDIWGVALPRFHVGGLGLLVRADLSRSRLAFFDRGWDPLAFALFLGQERVTLTSLVPTQIFDLCDRELRAPPSLRAVVVGGGPLAPELYERARRLGWPALASYGMTETASQVATAALDSLEILATPFQPAPLRLLGHVEARSNAAGCFEFRSGSLLSAQVNLGETNWSDPKIDGWFTSADRGEVVRADDTVRAFGKSLPFGVATFLVPQGRTSRTVKVMGENVNLDELGLRLKTEMTTPEEPSPEIAIIAVPDERAGFKLWLAVEAPRSDDLLGLVEYAQETAAAPFEKYERLFFVPRFPRSDLGKLQVQRLTDILSVLASHL